MGFKIGIFGTQRLTEAQSTQVQEDVGGCGGPMLRSKAAIAAKKPSGKKLFPVFFYGVREVPAVCQQKGCYGENHKGGFSLQPVKENYN